MHAYIFLVPDSFAMNGFSLPTVIFTYVYGWVDLNVVDGELLLRRCGLFVLFVYIFITLYENIIGPHKSILLSAAWAYVLAKTDILTSHIENSRENITYL